MATREPPLELKVADEVWIATALLHREHPDQLDFTPREIEERARREQATDRLRSGVYTYAVSHGVANRKPDPGRYRMLLETAGGRRRLFRPGDPYHPDRAGAKYLPSREAIPSRYAYLLDWYEADYVERSQGSAPDPLLALRGVGKEMWSDEDPDAYVARLREGWSN